MSILDQVLVYPWRATQGRDAEYGPVTWYTGAPISATNLNGCTATCMIRQLPSDSAPIISVSTTPNTQGVVILGGVAGTVYVVIFRAILAAFPAGYLGGATTVEGMQASYAIDILFPPNAIFPAGQNKPFGRGSFILSSTVDHP